MKRLGLFLFILALAGCGEGQKANPLPRAKEAPAKEEKLLSPVAKPEKNQ
jgi:hypothetical protein